MRSVRRHSFLLVALVCLVPLAARAADAPPADAKGDPRAVVEQRYQQIQQIIADTPDEQGMKDKIKALTLDFVDYDEFSKATIKESWDGLKPEQQKDFSEQFRRLIQATYARHFKPRQDITVTYRGDTEFAEGKAQVKTTVRLKDSAFDVDYRFLTHADGTWWVYDIVIDDVSLMRNYRGQFRKILKRDGFDGLMTKVREAVKKKEAGDEEGNSVE